VKTLPEEQIKVRVGEKTTGRVALLLLSSLFFLNVVLGYENSLRAVGAACPRCGHVAAGCVYIPSFAVLVGADGTHRR
jgi:hypothetical protein